MASLNQEDPKEDKEGNTVAPEHSHEDPKQETEIHTPSHNDQPLENGSQHDFDRSTSEMGDAKIVDVPELLKLYQSDLAAIRDVVSSFRKKHNSEQNPAGSHDDVDPQGPPQADHATDCRQLYLIQSCSEISAVDMRCEYDLKQIHAFQKELSVLFGRITARDGIPAIQKEVEALVEGTNSQITRLEAKVKERYDVRKRFLSALDDLFDAAGKEIFAKIEALTKEFSIEWAKLDGDTDNPSGNLSSHFSDTNPTGSAMGQELGSDDTSASGTAGPGPSSTNE